MAMRAGHASRLVRRMRPNANACEIARLRSAADASRVGELAGVICLRWRGTTRACRDDPTAWV